MMKYLDKKDVKCLLTDDEAPASSSTNGYGGKIPTRYRIQLVTGGIRRVYMMQYGNSGAAYIIINGEDIFVEDVVEELRK